MTAAETMHAINLVLIIIAVVLYIRRLHRDRTIIWAIPAVIWMIAGAVFSATYIIIGVHPDDNINYTEWARGLQTFGYITMILALVLSDWTDKHAR